MASSTMAGAAKARLSPWARAKAATPSGGLRSSCGMACLPPRWKATHPGSGCRSGTNSNTCDPAKIPAQSTTPYLRALDYLAKGLPVSKHWLLWRAKIFDQAALAETVKRLQDEGVLGQEKKDHDYPVLSRGEAEEAAKAP